MSDLRPTNRIGEILDDVAIHVERQVAPPDVRAIPRRAARRRRRRLLAAGTALVVVAGLVAATLVLVTQTPGSRGGPTKGITSHPVHFGNVQYVVKDLPDIAKETPSIPSKDISSTSLPVITTDYAAITFGGGRVWVLETRTGGGCALGAVTESSLGVVGTVPFSSCPDALVYGDGSVWVLSFHIGIAGYDLTQVDPSTLSVESTTVLDAGPGGVTPQGNTGAKYVFVTVWDNDIVATFQGANGRSQLFVVTSTVRQVVSSQTVPDTDGPVTALSTNSAGVWVGTTLGFVLRVDPENASIATARHVGSRVISLAASSTAVWVTVNLPVPPDADYADLDLLELDPTSAQLEVDTGLPMLFVAADGASVWALGSSSPYVSSEGLIGQIDPRTGKLLARAELPTHSYMRPDTVGVDHATAWVINSFLGTLTKVTS